MDFITDLATELLRRTPHRGDGITVTVEASKGVKTTTTKITTETAAKQIGKPVGTYINIESPEDCAAELSKYLRVLIPPKSRVLVVGLGNDRFVADSLGPQVLSYINTNDNLMTFEPNVGGITGIESVDAIKAITKLAKPDAVVVIDSLVSREADKIGTNYQIASSGISPGSGIARTNKRLDKKFLNVPVIAVGIPVCTILQPSPKSPAARKKTKRHETHIMHVVPKEIDIIIKNCALNIAAAVNTLQ
jgi:spore protease